MEQVKIFEGGCGDFEGMVNHWLSENADKVDIVRVLQSSGTSSVGSGDALHLTIFYTKKG